MTTTLSPRPLGATGLTLPPMGLGTAAIGGLYTVVGEAEAEGALSAGLEAGLSLVDTAPLYGYGLSEHRVGRQVRLYGRDRIVLSTKVGRLLQPVASPREPDDPWREPLPFEVRYDYGYDGVMRSFEDSLQRLGTDRIDILLLHDIGALTHGGDRHPALMAEAMEGGARAMRALKDQGAVRAIGLGVNEWEVCAEALDHAGWDVFLLAGRYTLLEQTVLDGFFPLCARRGVRIIVGGPYNSGILAGGDTFNYVRAPAEIMARARALKRVCDAHRVPLPAAALQFVLRHPVVASVIPGARSAAEVHANLAHLGHDIPDGLWSDLKAEGLLHADAP